MKTKTIKKVLALKMTEWIDTIDDTQVKNIARDNAIVTGGAIASLLLNEEVNDFDIYFKNPEAAKAVAEYYCEDIEDCIITIDDERVRIEISDSGTDVTEAFERAELNSALAESNNQKLAGKQTWGGDYHRLFVTENAITLTDQIQLITRFTGAAEDIHKNYDFIHATSSYDVVLDELTVPDGVFESLLNKELKYVGSLYPFASIVRTRKFINRGWQINAGQYLKMCFQLGLLDLSDPVTLKDQLTGVDLAYFEQVIDEISKGKKIHETPLFTAINRVFG